MKQIKLIVLVFVLMVSLTGCNNEKAGNEKNGETSVNEASEEREPAEVITFPAYEEANPEKLPFIDKVNNTPAFHVKVNLPASTSTPQPRPEKPVYLSVKADNSMFIGNDPVTDETMITALNALTEGKKDTTIFFRADKTVDYETLMKVMDTLHQAGYLKIGLVGEETAKAK